MARGRRTTRQIPPKRRRQQRASVRRRLNRNRRRRTNKPSFGTMIAKGTKDVLSTVPIIGSVLGDLADYAFKFLGLTNINLANKGEGSQLDSADVKVFNLQARFQVTPVVLLVGSKLAIANDFASREVLCAYRDGRIISLTVTIMPTNYVEFRQGDWTMSLNPYVNDNDVSFGVAGNGPISESQMRRAYMSITGPASKPLTLTYRPRVSEGRAFQFNPMESPFCEISIHFEQMIRSSYGHFSATDFACETLISGELEVRAGNPSANGGPFKFKRMVIDQLTQVGCYLMSTQGGGIGALEQTVIMKNDPNLKIEEKLSGNTTLLSVSGTVGRITNNTPIQPKGFVAEEFEFMSLDDQEHVL